MAAVARRQVGRSPSSRAPSADNQQAASTSSHATDESRPKHPTIGTFSTDELSKRGDPCVQSSEVVKFACPHLAPPGLAIGLTMLDISHKTHPRIKAYQSNVLEDSFKINLDCWADTVLFGASCAWLEITANDPDFQSGNYSTLEDHSWHQHETHNTRKITFRRPYQTPPFVVVWLSAIDMSHDRRWRIRTFATNVTSTGFTIHIDTWDDSLLLSAAASWVAYTATKAGVASGHFSTSDIRSPKQSMSETTGYEEFGPGLFKDPPRVIAALDSFDICNKDFFRLTARTSCISTAGMTWNLDTWYNSVLYLAGASYIALS